MFSVQVDTRGPSRLWTDVLESVAVTTEARGSLTSAAWLLSKLLSVLNHSRVLVCSAGVPERFLFCHRRTETTSNLL